MNAQKPLAIVTGGTGYLGSSIVKIFKLQGWNVVSLARRKSTDEDVYVCDITNKEEVQKVVDGIVLKYGKISAVIHAASPPLDRIPLTLTTLESFEKTMSVAVRGAFLLAKSCVNQMENNSAFIGITTQAIETGSKYQPYGAYVPSKIALRGLLRILAEELKSKRIRVFAVAPGFLPGGLNRDLPEKILNFFRSKVGSGVSEPEEVAAFIYKICTEPERFPASTSIIVPSGVTDPL